MEYKGIELNEFESGKTVVFDPPKRMLVWDYDDETPTEKDVMVFIPNRYFKVIEETSVFQHCAEIPKVTGLELVTYRELARWLAEGNGSVMLSKSVFSNWNYSNDDENKALDKRLTVRKWDDTEWHKPTREYLGLEDK